MLGVGLGEPQDLDFADLDGCPQILQQGLTSPVIANKLCSIVVDQRGTASGE